MRTTIFAAMAVAAIAVAGHAMAADTVQQATMKGCAANWKTVSPAEKAKTKYTDYMGTCMKAKPQAAPAMAMKPEAMKGPAMKPMAMKASATMGGQAKCKDGKMVTYKDRRGTCSGHGGVANWL